MPYPVTACNLRCSYCYVIQRGGRTERVPPLRYPVETMKRALSKDRFGGTCYFSICGAGETLIPGYTLQIVKALLENGHFVNVTTTARCLGASRSCGAGVPMSSAACTSPSRSTTSS